MAERRVALIVATDTYDDPTLNGLAAPTSDAAALADVLGDPTLGCFEVDVVHNATSWQLGERVEGLFGDVRSSDLVLLHFSCHGLKDDSGELYLAARNTRPDRLVSTALDSTLVNRLMQRSRAHRIVLLLDCCYGGAFERGVMTRGDSDAHVGDQFTQGSLTGGRGRAVITASSAMEFAFEGTELTLGGTPMPSLFTSALAEGIRTGDADRDQDGQVSLDELYDYVFDTVRDKTPNQTPSKFEFGTQGEIFIARNPHRRIAEAALAAELVTLAEHPVAGVRVGAVQELAQLVEGDDVARAAAAAQALHRLTCDDSRRVADAASVALHEAGLRLGRSVVDVGPVAAGDTAVVDVPIAGSALAMESAVHTRDPRVAARLTGGALRLEVTGSDGALDTVVTLTGPLGDLQVAVTAQPVDIAPPWSWAAPGPEPEPGRPPGPAATTSASMETAGPGWLATALGTAGATALVLAFTRPAEYEGVVVARLGEADKVTMSLPVLAATVAVGLLATRRAAGTAAGLLAGAAAWAGAFWARQTAHGWDVIGLGRSVEVMVHTQLMPWLAGSVLLGAAALLIVARTPALRETPALAVHPRSVVAALLVVGGAMVQTVGLMTRESPDGALTRSLAQSMVVAAVCLPVALTSLRAEQRRAALVLVTVFLLLSVSRDLWLIIDHDPQLDAEAGLSFVLAGCWLGQSAVPTWTRGPEQADSLR